MEGTVHPRQRQRQVVRRRRLRIARRLGIAAVGIALVAAVPGPGAGATSGNDSRCVKRGDRVLASSSRAAVAVPTDARGRYSGADAYGCLEPDGPRVDLAEPALDDDLVGPFRTAGPYVVYVGKQTDGSGEYKNLELRLFDLRKGYEDLYILAEAEDCFCLFFTDAVVNAHGAAGFIARSGSERHPFEVYRCNRNCRSPDVNRELVSRGGDVARKSLTYRDGVMRWRENGRLRSARLR